MPDSKSPPVDTPSGERPSAQVPPQRAKEPHVRAPVGACDAHIHIAAGRQDFALWEGRREDPPPGHGFEDWLGLLRGHLDTLGCTRGVIVQSILYGADNAITIEAVRRLGPQFRGVALVTSEVQDHTLDDLARARIRAVRLNLVHGGLLDWRAAMRLAPRLAERDMHLEILLHADRHLADIAGGIAGCPVPVVIDHAGWPSDGRADGSGIDRLCGLLSDGAAWTKLSALYRFATAGQGAALVRRLVEANPERCVWGSDWPHLMLGGVAMPDAGVLFDDFTDAIEDGGSRQRILVDNPARLYGFGERAGAG